VKTLVFCSCASPSPSPFSSICLSHTFQQKVEELKEEQAAKLYREAARASDQCGALLKALQELSKLSPALGISDSDFNDDYSFPTGLSSLKQQFMVVDGRTTPVRDRSSPPAKDRSSPPAKDRYSPPGLTDGRSTPDRWDTLRNGSHHSVALPPVVSTSPRISAAPRLQPQSAGLPPGSAHTSGQTQHSDNQQNHTQQVQQPGYLHSPPPPFLHSQSRASSTSTVYSDAVPPASPVPQRIQPVVLFPAALPAQQRAPGGDSLFSRCPHKFSGALPAGPGRAVPSEAFLGACDSLLPFIDTLGSTTFGPVKSDLSQNIEKVRRAYLAEPARLVSLQAIIKKEVDRWAAARV
jgi:hypothetical protein